MRRYTAISGLQDDVKIEINGCARLICEIMRIGQKKSPLIYEAELSGSRLREILSKLNIEEIFFKDISVNNNYIVTAYDW